MRTATALLAVVLAVATSAAPALAQRSSPSPSRQADPPRDPRLASDPSAHVALRDALHGDRPASRRMPALPTPQARVDAALRLSTLYQYWYEATWEDDGRLLFEYDDGVPTQIVGQVWTGSRWEDEYRTVYSYANGDLAEELYQFRAGTDWVTSSRLLYTYTDGNATEWREQIWAGSWADYRRVLLTYDAEGHYLDALVQDWDSFEAEWLDESRVFFTYTDAGTFAEIRGEFWTGVAWENSYLEAYAYDADRLLTELVMTGWDGQTWTNEYRESYTYADGFLVQSLGQGWDGQAWEEVYRVTFTNDVEGNPLEEVEQYFEGPDWVNESRSLHAYATTTSSEPTSPTASSLAVAVYPNPAHREATIGITLGAAETVEWAVYDVVGRRVTGGAPLTLGAGTHDVALPLTSLPAGVYVVRVRVADAVRVLRLTVVR